MKTKAKKMAACLAALRQSTPPLQAATDTRAPSSPCLLPSIAVDCRRLPSIACRLPVDCLSIAVDCLSIAVDCLSIAVDCLSIAVDCHRLPSIAKKPHRFQACPRTGCYQWVTGYRAK
jgi:hypothetical protein